MFYNKVGASLVVQWLRICLLMQGTRVRALVWEDPTCHGATGPVSHNYRDCASGACAPQREATIVRGPRTVMKSGPRLPQLEKALAQKRRPNTAKKIKKRKEKKRITGVYIFKKKNYKVNQLYIYIYPHISSLLRLPPTLPIPPL